MAASIYPYRTQVKVDRHVWPPAPTIAPGFGAIVSCARRRQPGLRSCAYRLSIKREARMRPVTASGVKNRNDGRIETTREGGLKWRVTMMWITNLASEGADTKGRGDSSGAREMKCVRGSATMRPSGGAAEMSMNTIGAGGGEIMGVPDTQSTTHKRLT